MNKNQEEHFLLQFLQVLKRDKKMYIDQCFEERQQVTEFEKVRHKYPGMGKVIEAIETNIGLWLGKVHFYDKAINYLNDLIEEKGLLYYVLYSVSDKLWN